MSEFIEFLSPSALSEMEKANAELVKMVANVKSVQTEMSKINTPSGGDAGVKQLTAQYQEQQKVIQSLQQQIQKLTESKQKTNAKTSEEIVNNRKLSQSADQAAKANSALYGAYEKLSISRTKAKNTLRDLIASENASTSEIKKAQREFDILDNKVRKADKAVGDFSKSVGNYKNALSGVGNLMGAFGISTGLYLAADLVKNIFETTKQLQSMDLALKMVSGSQTEFANNQLFLASLAEQYGIEIKGLTKNFTEFWVASKGKLEAEQIKEIFTSISKSVAVMGLSVEQQDSAFLALQQMMSKGTVQAEELKKQLGNALPGAVKAATMAYQALHPEIKVTEKIFMEQMKAGKILSAELLPELAKAYEKLYGIETVNRAETLAAAQNRLSNSWTDLIRSISGSNSGVITNFFNSAIQAANGFLMILTRINDSWDTIYKKAEEKGTAEARNTFANLMGSKKGDEAIKQAEQNIRIAKSAIESTVEQLDELELKLSKINPYLLNFGESPKSIKLKIEALRQQKGEYVGLLNLSEEFIKNQNKPATKSETPDGIDTKKEKTQKKRIELNFKEVESEYNLKLAILERKKADNADTEEKSYEERLKMRLAYSEATIQIIDAQLKKELAINEFKKKEDLDKAEEAFKQNKKNGYNDVKNALEYNKAIIDINNTFFNKNLTAHQKASQAINANELSDLEFWKKIQYKKEDENLKLNKVINEGEIAKYKSIADNEKNTLLVREAAFQKYIQLEKDLLKAQMQSDLARAYTRGASQDELDAIVQGYQNAIDAIGRIKSPKILALEEIEKQMRGFVDSFASKAGLSTVFTLLQDGLDKYGDNWKAKTVMIMEGVQEMYNFISQASQANFDAEYERLEQQKNISLAFAGDSAAAKEEIERQYEEKRKQIARREAKAKKQQAIMNIAIDTAQAIIGLWVNPGFPAAIPLSVAVGALGAAQIAMVSAQQIPEYWKGTDNAEGGLAWTQERGREIITDSQGRIKSTGSDKGAELTMLSKGDKVFTAEKSAMMFDNGLNSMLLKNGIVMPKVEVSMDAEKITNEIKSLANTISNNETIQVVSDGVDIIMKLKRKNEIVERTNKRIDFKGKSV